ncbi:MAG: HD domain-containing protein [bacterium]|nr:HD domain-containing protein [bacterium]
MQQRIKELVNSIRAPGPRAPDFIARAYEFAKRAYLDDLENGEEMLEHTTEVAHLLGAWGLGSLTMSAALLSKLPISDEVLMREVERELGTHLRVMVQRLRTLSLVSFDTSNSESIKSFSTFFIATAQDLRVLVIKIAEQLVLLRHASSRELVEAKQLAEESLTVYAPLADRLGMYEAVKELENLSFAIIHPRAYKKLSNILAAQEEREALAMSRFVKKLSEKLQEVGMEPLLEERTKTIYNIYKKATKKKTGVSHLYDIHALRIIVSDTGECYRALGIVHGNWRPVQGRMKDYIALPKQNGYQSLHTSALSDDGITVEIQIRTREMHYNAQFGFASHATYKHPEGADMLHWFPHFFPPPALAASEPEDETLGKKLPEWITSLTEPRSYVAPAFEEHDRRQSEFFKVNIFVFNSEGHVTRLSKNASVADYLHAHALYTSDRANILVRVNETPATLETLLDNGDIIDIEVASGALEEVS